MGIFKIKGNKKLKGEIQPQGAKNESLQVLCATLLTSEKLRIKNIPEIGDIKSLIVILKNLGVSIKKNGIGDYTFQSKNININYLNKKSFYNKYARSIRGSIMIVGPLLTRFGKVCMPIPGGDRIGRRRLDAHLNGLKLLGGIISYQDKNKCFYLHTNKKKLIGKYILMEEASITGTANIIMAATLSIGNTTIYNAACEPYIQQLCKLLNNMGAKIQGIGTNLIQIEGVNCLKGCEHIILPDMVEIGSWIGLAALTASEIRIKNVSWNNLGIIPITFNKMGIEIKKEKDDIYIPSQKSYHIKKLLNNAILTISDSPWPGLTPDLLSILIVVATQAKGSILIHQKMFESRLFFVDKLIEMGAQIILCDPHRATVIGLNHQSFLRGSILNSPDIRAGIALLIAALSAKGTSIIKNIEQIDRGYENIDGRLRNLGADIQRIE